MPDNSMYAMMQAQAAADANANAQRAITQGHDTAIGRYSTNYYDPYSQAGGQGLDMSLNALGMNGAAGNQAATNAFQASPGYKFQMDQGMQAINRAAAARGMLGSGNNTIDLLKYAQGLANQEYGNWQNRLGSLADLGMNAAQGQTGRQGSMSNIDMNAANMSQNSWNNYGSNMQNALQPPQQTQKSGLGAAIGGGLGLAGTAAGAYFGGPAGAAAGGKLGYSMGALGAGSTVPTYF